MERKAYASDISNEEWAFVAPYLTLMREDAPQRDYELRELFNGTQGVPGWVVRTGAAWRLMPHDLPPRYTVYQQTRRWLKAGVFETLVHDLRVLLRIAAGRDEQPTAAIFDGRTFDFPRKGEAFLQKHNCLSTIPLIQVCYTEKAVQHGDVILVTQCALDG